MSKLFKHLYDEIFFEELSIGLAQQLSNFDKTEFLNKIHSDNWENKELKQRMRHIAEVLQHYFDADFNKSVLQLLTLVDFYKSNKQKALYQSKNKALALMFLPDFIELYGILHYEQAINTLEQTTQLTSCEFAVRPFIIQYPTKIMQQMLVWARHSHPQVRRLATEGCRPRLPWAMALPALKSDPTEILPILELLKNDESETVRRSVANNLNDIAKDNPKVVIKLAQKWFGTSTNVDWVVKHGCRTLLKQGNQEVMSLFGYGDIQFINLCDFVIHTPKVTIGSALDFSFKINNFADQPQKIRLEYAIYYQKANGTLSKKVYKINEKQHPAKSVCTIERKQSFKIITTRKFYVGKHQLAIIINGYEQNLHDFELIS